MNTQNKVIINENEPKRKEINHGTYWQEETFGRVYLLGFLGDSYVLISLAEGHFYTEPKTNIQDAFGKGKFTQITLPFTVEPLR